MATLLTTLKKILVNPPIDTKNFYHYIYVEYLSFDTNAQLLMNVPIDCMEKAIEFYQPNFQQKLSKKTPSRIANAYISLEKSGYKGTINFSLIAVDDALKLLTNIDPKDVNLFNIFLEKYHELQEANADCDN